MIIIIIFLINKIINILLKNIKIIVIMLVRLFCVVGSFELSFLYLPSIYLYCHYFSCALSFRFSDQRRIALHTKFSEGSLGTLFGPKSIVSGFLFAPLKLASYRLSLNLYLFQLFYFYVNNILCDVLSNN